MSPQRAQEIWDTRLPFGELFMTDPERMAVRKVWSGMPGHTCFADALLRIARGEAVAEKPVMIGTAVFTYGDEIIEQVPVYAGETAGSDGWLGCGLCAGTSFHRDAWHASDRSCPWLQRTADQAAESLREGLSTGPLNPCSSLRLHWGRSFQDVLPSAS